MSDRGAARTAAALTALRPAAVKCSSGGVDVPGDRPESQGAAAAAAAGRGLFQKRRHQRVKRRFVCDFLAEGQRYRGIIVELSSSGLFVQTDATIPPGCEIELHLAGAGVVPDIRMRAVVVRRRMVPAPLAAVVRRGVALEILEAPREYGLAFGSELLDAPIRLSRSGGGDAAPGAGRREVEPAADLAGIALPAAPPAPPPPRREPEAVRDERAPEAPRPEALVVDDGTLGDVRALLGALGVECEALHLGLHDAAPSFAWPRRLLVTSARLACSMTLPDPSEREDAIVAIAIAADGSQTLSTMMRRLGFQYLVHRPFHPEALRVLLSKILYRGAEQRRAERVAFGAEVSWRTGWARRRGILVDISASGCRLQSDRPLRPGARIRIAIPPTATGERALALRGRVLRRDAGAADASDAPHGLAVGFDPLPSRAQRRLDGLLGRLARGPAALARRAAQAAAPSPPPTPIVPLLAEEPAPEPAPQDAVVERRRLPRGRLDREVVALDATGSRALHALVGRDLSPAGMRIDPHPELALHERLHLALYEPSEPSPLLVDAEVSRDDGEAGLALHFLDVAPETGARLERMVAALPAMESLRPEPQRIVLGEFFSECSVA